MWSRFPIGVVTGTTGVLAAFAATAISTHDKQPAVGGHHSTSRNPSENQNHFQDEILKSTNLIKQLQEKSGAPGIVVGVSVDGRTVWQQGFGVSDVENGLPCSPETVMRIASISKSITMAVAAQLWENGQLDLDKPVHEYVPHFPKKTYPEGNEKSTSMTSRHLASHQSGVRHYKKKKNGEDREWELEEFNLKDKFKTVADALKIFQDDPLHFEPGTDFLYTTYGWTVLSAVIEKVSRAPFSTVARRLFTTMGLKHTYLDENEPIIYNRSRFYTRNKNGELQNSPHVDNSSKWAGGGFLSDVGDLLRFGNVMLYAAEWQQPSDDVRRKCPPGFLTSKTVQTLWTPTSPEYVSDKWGWSYGLGWTINPQRKHCGMCGPRPKKIVFHDGGAMGASSTLVLRLSDVDKDGCQSVTNDDDDECLPRGVVVAMITNLHGVRLRRVAIEIAELFDRSDPIEHLVKRERETH